MRRILDTALSAGHDAEVFNIKMEKYPVHFAGNKLKSIKSDMSRGIGLRINHGGKIGFSSDSNPNDPDALVSRAIASSKLGEEASFEFCKDKTMTPVDIFDPGSLSFDIEESVEMAERSIKYILKEYPDSVNDATITRYFMEISYLSDGVEKTYYKTMLIRYLSSMIITDDGFINIDEMDGSSRIPSDPYTLSRRIVQKIPQTQAVFEMPSKPTTVIFHPKAVYNLLQPLVTGLSGTNLLSGSSPLTGRHNKKILDDSFTLVDDPTLALGPESESFDAEGLPRRRQVLFDRGVLNSYILDQKTANKLGYEPNACATRGLSSPPSPGASNLVVLGGDVPYGDMLSGIKDGLIVEEVIGGGQSNVMAGEFSVNVSLGFKVKNGKIMGRVRNTMMAGNVYDLLKNNLSALSVETEAHGSITAPYFMIKDISISGKG